MDRGSAVKSLHLGLFETPVLNVGGTATWAHPENQSYRHTELGYWVEMAQRLEDARFDFLFLADSYGYSEIDGQRPDVAWREALDLPRLDPGLLIPAMAHASTALGFVVTMSTMFETPYSAVRRLATLDHLTQGRLGWNVVTASFAPAAAAAFGVPMTPHDQRYAQAEEFLDLAYKLFEGSWAPDAVRGDKAARVFTDPARVRRIEHDGQWFKSSGYPNTARTPQGTPVIFQAGSSAEGRAVGGRHAECVFLQGTTVPGVRGFVDDIRAQAALAGREPLSVKTIVGTSIVVAPTRELAQAKYQEYLDLQTLDAAIASYAMFTGVDLRSYDPQDSFESVTTEMGRTQVDRHKSAAASAEAGAPARAKTIREVLMEYQQRGVRGLVVVGSPEDVVNQLAAIVAATDVDGFLLEPWVEPGSVTDLVEQVLPVLRARGMFREEYQESTLRERMSGPGSVWLSDDHPGAAARWW
jgi:FMN-dependent oxidoreductase (nitrilotriacetate monooxygenase family)